MSDDQTNSASATRLTRAEAKAERCQQLIEATIESIGRFGLSGTTMGKVTGIAGVSVGLAIFHFASKDRLLEATWQHLAAEERAMWYARHHVATTSLRDRLLAIVESRFHPAICARHKLAVWFAFYGDASARAICRKTLGDTDDERLHATVALFNEMIAEAGYTIDPLETALSLEAMDDGLWLNMLLYPAEFRRATCRTRALNMIAALFPRHFDTPPKAD